MLGIGLAVPGMLVTSLGIAAPPATGSKPSTPPPLPSQSGRTPTTGTPATAPPPGSATPPPPPSAGGTKAGEDQGSAAEHEAPPQDLSETWSFSRRAAPRPRYTRSTTDPIIFSPNPIGFYSGVSLQGNKVPPKPSQTMGQRPVELTWTGFERIDQGSRVYFQLSASPKYEVTKRDTQIVIRMSNTRPTTRNNLRRLDLSYFKTPVKGVDLRRRGKDVIATITLKRPASSVVEVTSQPEAGGYQMLVVTFEGEGPTAADQDPATPPPPP